MLDATETPPSGFERISRRRVPGLVPGIIRQRLALARVAATPLRVHGLDRIGLCPPRRSSHTAYEPRQRLALARVAATPLRVHGLDRNGLCPPRRSSGQPQGLTVSAWASRSGPSSGGPSSRRTSAPRPWPSRSAGLHAVRPSSPWPPAANVARPLSPSSASGPARRAADRRAVEQRAGQRARMRLSRASESGSVRDARRRPCAWTGSIASGHVAPPVEPCGPCAPSWRACRANALCARRLRPRSAPALCAPRHGAKPKAAL